MSVNSIAIISAANPTVRNGDVEHLFRQNSDFYYLTGFAEEHAVLVLLNGEQQQRAILFCQPKIPEQEIWTGRRLGPEAAPSILDVDQAFSIEEIDEKLPEFMQGKHKIYANIGHCSSFDQQIMQWRNQVKAKVRHGAVSPNEISDLGEFLNEARLIKSDAEIDVMQKAADISADAHTRAMQMVRPGLHEFQLEAEINRVFMDNGSRWPAYPSIVGSGDNACILHYTANTDQINDGDLILIDAGCELDYYAADITRTFPANGRFSAEQAALYQVVLDAQKAAIAAVKPGNHWNQPHEEALRVLTAGLVELGLLEGDIDKLIEEQAYHSFYMHRTGHWLGMDVHDVGNYQVDGDWRPLQPGMVLTVEPGLYVAPDNQDVEARWRGIGIRIEDDVLVTPDGCRVLTDKVVKEIADIEALIQNKPAAVVNG